MPPLSPLASTERLSAKRVFFVAALAASSSWLIALVVRGRLHADEIFQVLEPASRLAFGYGELTWEWKEGVRNWATPGIVAGLLRIGSALGIHHALSLEALVWLACALLCGVGVACWVRLIEERDGARAAWLGGLVMATWGGLAVYGARTLGDVLCLAPLAGSLLAQARAVREDSARRGLAVGALLGLAVILRYGSLLFVATATFDLLRARRPRALLGMLLGLAIAAAFLGILDAETWGQPFHSLLAYWRFNGSSRVVETFGARPPWWYLGMLAAMVPQLLVLAFARGFRRLDGATLAFGVYLLAVAAHPHKEARFLLPLVPLWIVIAAGPLEQQLADLSLARRRLALGAHALLSVAAATWLLPFGLRREEVDGVVACGESARAGVQVVNRDHWAQAGDFHLQRDAPVVMLGTPAGDALADPRFDCAIMQDHEVADEVMARAGYSTFWAEGEYAGWKK